MNKKKLKKLRSKLEAYQRSPYGIKSADLASLAKQLGRERVNQGKEPTYMNGDYPQWGTLTIPGHSGDLKIGTARSIIDTLLSDADEWEMVLDQDTKQDEEADNE
ncbi:MAG: hypothetical protein M0Z68_04060 [Gammaproteobacteria bacterium]|nr:hypothetical protein [Gammaproteobacteria bacterium]